MTAERLIRNDDLSSFKKDVGASGQRGDWHGIVSAERANCWKKKATGKTGKAYQTGFQITEVIPSVIDSPIATYRISEGNYKEGGKKAREMCERGAKGGKNGTFVSDQRRD